MSSSPYPQRASTASRKLRVGWVSSDLRRHAVGYFVVPVLEQLAHANIELLLYYNNTQDDDMSRRARATASVWRETAQLSDTQLAGQIRNDAPDILIDLGGHTEGSRIEVFAQRLAPVQITWLGFPGTSGLANMDYIFVPPDAELLKGHWCSEKPLVLPGCYGAREAAHIPVLASYEAPCLRTGFIQFGCLNNFAKVSPLAVKTWASILLAVDDARLTLVVTNADDPGVHDEITGRFAALGVDPSRLDLISRMPPEDYLACYRKIDIALDSLPFNGGTTGLDALSMSTPFITLEGDALHSRMGANLLRTVQEDALIARSPEEYIDKTIALTKDRARLISLHSNLRLRLQDSALLDVASFAQGMQHVLETTAARHGISTQQ